MQPAILGGLFCFVCFTGLAQGDTVGTRLQRHYLKVNTFQVMLGEAGLYYGYKFNKQLQAEGSLGYVYFDIYDMNTDNHNYKIANTAGVTGSLGLKRHLGTYGPYFEAQYYYKRLKRDSILKHYVQSADYEQSHTAGAFFFPYEEKVCDQCAVTETDTKQVHAVLLLTGLQRTFGKTFTLDVYTGLGFRLRIFDINIHQIDDWEIDHTFFFDDYQLRIYQYYPTVHFGLKVGFAF